MSAIPAALASAATIKNGTPVVITLSCAFAKETANKQSRTMVFFFIFI
jgi:hypothetical protein